VEFDLPLWHLEEKFVVAPQPTLADPEVGSCSDVWEDLYFRSFDAGSAIRVESWSYLGNEVLHCVCMGLTVWEQEGEFARPEKPSSERVREFVFGLW